MTEMQMRLQSKQRARKSDRASWSGELAGNTESCRLKRQGGFEEATQDVGQGGFLFLAGNADGDVEGQDGKIQNLQKAENTHQDGEMNSGTKVN